MATVAEGKRERIYLPPDPVHEAAANVKRPDDAPETELPEQALGFRVQAYGMTHHADLFTNRQLVALVTFSELVGEARTKVFSDSHGDHEYSDAVATYLAFALDKGANLWSSITSWMNDRGAFRETFARQALSMVWDYAEANRICERWRKPGDVPGQDH